MENNSFKSFEPKNGLLSEQLDPVYGGRLYCLVDGYLEMQPCMVYVHEGAFLLNEGSHEGVTLKSGMYASLKEQSVIYGKGLAIIIEVKDYLPMRSFGGPIEEEGRLKYIDGCTDSLLIPPVKKGDPCLNHLHFPNGILQTPHTHPTVRVGMVTKGTGECITPFGNVPLNEGTIFVIKPSNGEQHRGTDGNYYEDGTHSFRTFEEHMDVIAFHPDSDFGPEDEDHPMINRTIVNGVSANSIKEIQTR